MRFAQAHFGLGWALPVRQRPEKALSEIDKAYPLSPRDPLLFGIAASRAIALMILERYGEAVQWARIALRQPNSHFRTRCRLRPSAMSGESTRANT
jgi:hypothetical protein